MKLWLDDVRPAPPGWLRTTTVAQTIAAIAQGGITDVSLDYDLDYTDPGHKGIEVMYWLLHAGYRPTVHIHTANPMGGAKMAVMTRRLEGR
jgi:hypothetical protein